jgi:hypothetical protein
MTCVIEYFSSYIKSDLDNIFFKEEDDLDSTIGQDSADQQADSQGNETIPTDAQTQEPSAPQLPPPVEYEGVKKYILLLKLKQIKRKIDFYNTNSDIMGVTNDIDIILTFFNGFKYNDIVKFLNDIINKLSKISNIKIEGIPELDNVVGSEA